MSQDTPQPAIPDWAEAPSAESLRDCKHLIWRHLNEYVRGLVASRLRGIPPEDQEDLVQEAMVKVFMFCSKEQPRNLRQVGTKAVSWVLGSYWQRRRVRSIVDPCEPGELPEVLTPEDPIGRPEDPWNDLATLVFETLARLRPDCVEIATLRFYSGLDYEAMAPITGATAATLRKRWERGAVLLRRVLVLDPRFCELFDIV